MGNRGLERTKPQQSIEYIIVTNKWTTHMKPTDFHKLRTNIN